MKHEVWGARAVSEVTCVAAAFALAAAFAGAARADEGGVSYWLPGQYSSLSAVPTGPGLFLGSNTLAYSGSAGGAGNFPIGVAVVAHVKASAYGDFFTALYVPSTPVLGGELALAMTAVYLNTTVEGKVKVGPFFRSRKDTIWAFGDLYPMASLGWNKGVHNWKVYLTGDIPVGAYQSSRLANVGLGHGAIDGGGAYTYLDPTKGREFSATIGFTGNFENTQTRYTNGVDFHVDLAAAQFISKQVYVGAAGYIYQQVSGDSGPGAVLGPFESRVFGAGPEVGYLFAVGGHQASLNARVYGEFEAAHRTQGVEGLLSLAIPLWAPTAPPPPPQAGAAH